MKPLDFNRCLLCNHSKEEHYTHKYTKNPICRFCGVAADGSMYHYFKMDNLRYLEEMSERA